MADPEAAPPAGHLIAASSKESPPPYQVGASSAPRISKRQQKVLNDGAAMLEMIRNVLDNQWSEENPDGYVNLAVAENKLMHPDLIEYFDKIAPGDLKPDDLTYGDTARGGQRRIFAAIIPYLNEHFHPVKPLKPDQIIGFNGVSGVMEELGHILCDEGEHVLIAAPYYLGFDNDLGIRANAPVIPVHFPNEVDPGSPDTLKYFEKTIREVRAQVEKGQDKDVRAILLCNPQNPLGFCYPKETILAYMQFAEKYDLHLLCDEIYAKSIYNNPNCKTVQPFISALSIDPQKEAGCNPARVHVAYGMSKDFCANGFRLGFLISQYNQSIIDSGTLASLFHKIASPSDALFSALITDEVYLPLYFERLQKTLADAYSHSTAWLRKRRIPYREANAGHFIWIDLRGPIKKLLQVDEGKELSWEDDARFLKNLLEARVMIAPGQMYHSPLPGFYRMSFTQSADYTDRGLARLDELFGWN